MEDTGLPSDALRWTLEYFISQWSESLPVIIETLEDAGAPQLVLDTLTAMECTCVNEEYEQSDSSLIAQYGLPPCEECNDTGIRRKELT